MRREDVEHALDALASEAPAPTADTASVIARGRRRVMRQRFTIVGLAILVVAAAATIGAVAHSRRTTHRLATVVAPAPTTTISPANAGPQFVEINAVSALEAWKCLDPLQYTNDGGRTWREVNPPASVLHDPHGNPPACAAVTGGNAWSALTTHDPAPAQILRVRRGSDAEVFPFPRQTAPFSVVAGLTFFDARHGWVLIAHGTSREVLYRTLDGGRTWTVVAEKQQTGYVPVFTSATRGWARNSDQVLTTSDGGATWGAVTMPAAPRKPGFKPELEGVVIAHGPSVVVWKGNWNGTYFEPFFDASTDGGRTWSQRRGPRGLKIKGNADSQFDAPDALHWRLYSGEALWVTNDGGRTWARRGASPVATYVESMSFPTADVGWISGRSSRSAVVLRTADAGRTWTDVTNGRPLSPTSVAPIPGGIIGCPTRPLTPTGPGNPPPGLVAAAIGYVRTERHYEPTVAHVYRVGTPSPTDTFASVFSFNVGSCGKNVVDNSWVVELYGPPGQGGGGSTAQAQIVLAHYADGWHVFGRYH